MPVQKKAFISYSHADQILLDRLLVHLKPLIKKYDLDIWSDRKLRAGEKWREKIEFALSHADVIIVILSADFLASDFIMDYEYPKALHDANTRGAKIVVLFASPCLYKEFDIAEFRFVNDPTRTLQDLQGDATAAESERTFMNCAAIVLEYLK